MSNDLVVFMPHFEGVDERVYAHNFQSFVRHNPDTPIVRFDEKDCKDSYWQKICKFKHMAWRNCDLLIYDFYRQNPQYERYLYVEWDTYCTMDVRKLVDPVRQFDVLCTEIKYQGLDADWPWFKEISTLPKTLQYIASGMVPACGISFSANALARMSRVNELHSQNVFCELRVGTLAAHCDLSLAVYPSYAHGIRWNQIPVGRIGGEGIWHAVKCRFSEETPVPGCPAVGTWLGRHPHWTTMLELQTNGRINNAGLDSGRWSHFPDGELVLSWNDYPSESLVFLDNDYAERGNISLERVSPYIR